MASRFEGKAIIVTGAAGSIGAAIAARFAAEGAGLLLADIDEAGLAAAADRQRGQGGDILTRRVDVSRQEDDEAMVAEAVGHFGRLDVLVNNAAVGSFGRVTELDPAEWRRIFAVGVDSVFFASRAAIPHLSKTRGSIVNIGSISGLFGDYGLAAYNSMKGAVANLTRTMALDHAADGVRVNTVAPGAVQTPKAEMLDDILTLREEFRRIPMGRKAEPREVAAAVAFLASEDAAYITGIHLVVDGGLTAATGQPNFTNAFGGMDK
jgi:meso-butanediol dehydrogenase/(S,S)-butanediol dehydrogenase/diacetyl reductase